MGSFRRSFVILASFSLVAMVVFLSYSGEQIGESKPIHFKWLVDNRGFLLDTPGCRIPDWDPYDPSVKPFFERIDGTYKCPGRPQLLSTKFNAVVTMDHSVLSFHYGFKKDNVSCTYQPIRRYPGPPQQRTDNKFLYGDTQSLEFNVPLNEDFIQATCHIGELPAFTQYIALIPLKPDVEKRAEKLLQNRTTNQEDNLNIIIVGIDSVSKLNFLRHFRKTHRFLKENLSPIELRGYTKVADNTFPNLVPLLTGHFIEYYWNESMREMFFDHIDLIWKNFSTRGYRTLMAEDAPSIATFNYLKRGFRDPPADYYFRPFALAVEKSRMKQQSRTHCLQSKLEMEVLYDYLKNFVGTMAHRPHFAFTFVARLTHDKLNSAGYADEPSFQLLRDLHDSGALNRSLLVLFSDHGIRFGPIRQTYIGKFEERMPFIYLFFPEWFFHKYPEYGENLRKNQGRLTTPFDIHATLVHMLNLTSEGPSETNSTNVSSPHGLSLFSEIPEHRTCSDAFILPHWCPCQIHKPVLTHDPIVVNAAQALMDTINEMIKPFYRMCEPLRIKNIMDARVGQANEDVLRFVKHVNDVINRQVVLGKKTDAPLDYLLTVEADPSGGIFEGTVRFEESERTYRVLDDISRINMYGNQSMCIDDAKIRKFCFCRETLLPTESLNSSIV